MDNSSRREGAFPINAKPATLRSKSVCLNFKVPLRVRQQLKIYAARHNMTMTEMLLTMVDDCLSLDVNSDSVKK